MGRPHAYVKVATQFDERERIGQFATSRSNCQGIHVIDLRPR